MSQPESHKYKGDETVEVTRSVSGKGQTVVTFNFCRRGVRKPIIQDTRVTR